MAICNKKSRKNKSEFKRNIRTFKTMYNFVYTSYSNKFIQKDGQNNARNNEY